MMQGLGDSLISVLTGEVARVYPQEKVLSRVSILVGNYYLFFILGPAFAVLFSCMHPFTWYCFGAQFRFTMYNLPNVVLGFIWLVNIVLNLLFVSDLSKEYDLKEATAIKQKQCNINTEEALEDCIKSTHHSIDEQIKHTEEATKASLLMETSYQNNEPDDNDCDCKTKDKNYTMKGKSFKLISCDFNELYDTKESAHDFSEHIPLIQKTISGNFEQESLRMDSLISKLFQWKEFRTIIIINFLCAYISVAFFDIALPLVCTNAFKMKAGMVGIAFSATGISFIVTLVIITLKMNSLFANSKEKVLVVSGVVVLIIAMQSLTLSVVVKSKGNALGADVFLGLYTVALGIGWSLEQVILGVILTKMIPSHNQGYAEGIRRSVSSIGYIIAGIVTPLLGEYLTEQSIFFSGLAVMVVIYLLVNKFKFAEQ